MQKIYPTRTLPKDLESSCPIERDEEALSLTKALAAGNEQAWHAFHADYRKRLYAYLQRIWQGPEAALDDLVQETFLRAAKYMRPFASQEALWSWLTVLARSATADHGRKQSRFRNFIERFRKEPLHTSSLVYQDLDSAMAKLPAETANLLRQKYQEGWSVKDIASQLKLSDKAVENRLTRARQSLRKLLTQPNNE